MRGSAAFACFLDCTKAFDTVNHDLLFDKLRYCRISQYYLRLLCHCYSKQMGYVRWGDADSTKFQITNGVRQGGILSPIFFNIYTTKLLSNLASAGHAGLFMCALAYADDIVLAAPSLSSLRKMVLTCERYAAEHFVTVNGNASKTVCMHFPAGRHSFAA